MVDIAVGRYRVLGNPKGWSCHALPLLWRTISIVTGRPLHIPNCANYVLSIAKTANIIENIAVNGRGDVTLDDTSIRTQVATKLRSLRKEHGATLSEVAEKLGISSSQLSRIENGNQDISVVEMMRFAELYGVNVVEFFLGAEDEEVIVTRRKRRPRVVRNVSAHGPIVQEILTHVGSVAMEPSLILIPPLGDSGEPLVHAGEEFITVLDGSIRIWVGSRVEDLDVGDTVYYPCTIPHHWVNLENRPASLLAVSTPPSY